MVKPVVRGAVGTTASFIGGWALTGWLDDQGFGPSAKAVVWIACAIIIFWLWLTDDARKSIRRALYSWRQSRPVLSFLVAAVVGAVVAPALWWLVTLRPPAPVAKSTPEPSVPGVSVHYMVMPFDVPYPPGTKIAGIEFKPKTLDVRLRLSVERASIRNCELKVLLIETSGQLLGIQALAQLTGFPRITAFPEFGDRSPGGVTIQNPDGSYSRLPIGAEAPQAGKLTQVSRLWRIHAESIPANTTPEFVLMVRRPYRRPMIEGFLTILNYEFGSNSEPTAKQAIDATLFTDKGEPRAPTPDEAQKLKALFLKPVQ